ncbi:5927_t:CDS:1, partial [Entrophospora sp. SA101]
DVSLSTKEEISASLGIDQLTKYHFRNLPHPYCANDGIVG